MEKLNLNLDEIGNIRVDSEKDTMKVYLADESLGAYTFDIEDVMINGDSMVGKRPSYLLKTSLIYNGFTVSGGWLFLNQNVIWHAANSNFDYAVAL